MPLKNVLLITYYWPPSGGAGVQRPVKLVKNLRKHGINTIVLTVDPEQASYGISDHSLLKEVPEGTEVITTGTSEPFGLYKKLSGRKQIPTAGFSTESKPGLFQKISRFIRGNFFIPDARVGWVKHALKAAEKLIREKEIDVVITTSPPHSLHLVGLKLKKTLDIRWIVDLNDPWTDIYYYKEMLHTPVAKYIDRRYEKAVLEQADELVTVSADFKRLFLEKTNAINKEKFTLIPNGFDKEDFVFASDPPRDAFVITYTGTIANSYHTEIFFDAVADLLRKDPACRIRLRFVGVMAIELKNYIAQIGIGDYVEQIPSVPHEQSIRYLAGSTALFLAIPDVKNDKGICPGKLFEYLAAHKPVICIGSPDGDAAAILHECQTGETFGRTAEEKQRLFTHLEVLYKRWLLNPNLDIKGNDEQVARYERSVQAAAFAGLIKWS